MKNSASLIISSTLWIIWGLVHLGFGQFRPSPRPDLASDRCARAKLEPDRTGTLS
jgi:hypothetical protein